MKSSASALLSASRRDLYHVLATGHPIAEGSLDDTEYRGISVGLPRWAERFSWKTFRKTFHRDPKTGRLRGWNVRMEQTGIEGPSVHKNRNGAPWVWGHYSVERSGDATMINYGVPENSFLLRRMRDPIVALEAGSSDALLGVSYLDFGWFRVLTPTYFVLLREGPLSYVP